jgi:hypothetical protein
MQARQALRKERKEKEKMQQDTANLRNDVSRNPLTQVNVQGSEAEAEATSHFSHAPTSVSDDGRMDKFDQAASTASELPTSQSSEPSRSAQESISQTEWRQNIATSDPSHLLEKAPTYDKRMPPPPVNWKNSKPGSKLNVSPLPTPTMIPSKLTKEIIEQFKLRRVRASQIDKIMGGEICVFQTSYPPLAGRLSVAEIRNQQNLDTISENRGHNPNRKRSRDDEDEVKYSATDAKKRKLKSDYCPAVHTNWRPVWLDTTQCYPMDETGDDMSDIECLRGDAIHRNADKMKKILETGCMYIPTNQVDELMMMAQEMCDLLKRTKDFTTEHQNEIRIERHEFK